METVLAKNAYKFDYFSIYEFIDKITLDPSILSHAFETEVALSEYMEDLTSHNNKVIDLFLTNAFYKEIKESNLIEGNLIYPEEILNGDIYLDTFNMNHTRIKNLHHFIERGTGSDEYRNIEAWVRLLTKDQEIIYWYGAKPKDIFRFMEDFIKLYNDSNVFGDNIFLKCILIHLILVKIHPFKDGNGRTTRLISDIKFTEMINNLYGLDLKISPLHISQSIYRNKATYNKKLDNICFDLEHFSNSNVNDWFNFMLNMYDEQLYYMANLLKRSKVALENANAMLNDKFEISKHLILK